jgi:hypothetical protein
MDRLDVSCRSRRNAHKLVEYAMDKKTSDGILRSLESIQAKLTVLLGVGSIALGMLTAHFFLP